MHYLDEGDGAPVLLLHGEPTWSIPLAQDRAAAAGAGVAPDLIGFGAVRQAGGHRLVLLDRHVESIARLVVELDLTGLTLVVHD